MTKQKSKHHRLDTTPYFMLAPGYLIYFIFIMVPVFYGIYYSFTNYAFYGKPGFVGFSNYRYLLKDSLFIKSIGNTVVYTVFTVIPQMVLGLFIANALNKSFRTKSIWRGMIYMPNVTSMVAVSMIWLWLFDPASGFLNMVLRSIGQSGIDWLYNPDTAMPCIIVVGVWKVVGYNMIIYLAGLQAVPQSLYEVAQIDGAGSVRQFFSITLPLLKPTTFFLLVMNTIQSFQVFEQVSIMTNGGPLNTTTTIVHQIYTRAFLDFKMGYASSMAVILLFVIATATFLNFKFGGDTSDVD
ncbi:MAG: sugar ABC transporter permease [Spirochaetales bacterium]|nr:sugar ABC transporter permease [Spirochaetales bacterium]